MLCDNLLPAGWFRVISGAGENMPTDCEKVSDGKCGTARPIYLSNGGWKFIKIYFWRKGTDIFIYITGFCLQTKPCSYLQLVNFAF